MEGHRRERGRRGQDKGEVESQEASPGRCLSPAARNGEPITLDSLQSIKGFKCSFGLIEKL